MPLQLESSQREQLITFDPADGAQRKEAYARCTTLISCGYKLVRKSEDEGELVLAPPARDPAKGLLLWLSDKGDEHLVWDRSDPAQVREAFAKFKELLAKGFTAYAVRNDGTRGHRIHEFDPAAYEIRLVPGTIPG